MCELAMELGMTLDDLGRRESNYNVCVVWPAFIVERNRLRDIERAQQEHQAQLERSRI